MEYLRRKFTQLQEEFLEWKQKEQDPARKKRMWLLEAEISHLAQEVQDKKLEYQTFLFLAQQQADLSLLRDKGELPPAFLQLLRTNGFHTQLKKLELALKELQRKIKDQSCIL